MDIRLLPENQKSAELLPTAWLTPRLESPEEETTEARRVSGLKFEGFIARLSASGWTRLTLNIEPAIAEEASKLLVFRQLPEYPMLVILARDMPNMKELLSSIHEYFKTTKASSEWRAWRTAQSERAR